MLCQTYWKEAQKSHTNFRICSVHKQGSWLPNARIGCVSSATITHLILRLCKIQMLSPAKLIVRLYFLNLENENHPKKSSIYVIFLLLWNKLLTWFRAMAAARWLVPSLFMLNQTTKISQTISIKFEICKNRHMIEMKKKENGLQPVQANDNQYP